MFPAEADPDLTNHGSSSDSISGRTPKNGGQFRVYNRSREDFLSLEVAMFDTTTEPLKRLFDFLIHGLDTGLWLKPYRGIPASQGARFFDLVYLDEENRVAWSVDHYPNPQYTVLEEEPASALLLPAHTAFASQLRQGDQLSICSLEELEGFLKTLAATMGEDSSRSSAEIRTQTGRSEYILLDSGAQGMPSEENVEPADSSSAKKESLGARIKRWLSFESPSSSRSNRQMLPGLVAYHWSGGKPEPYQLGNISESGFFLLTDERPYPGTLILMTLQRAGSRGDKVGNSIAVYSKVIRWGPDGVGFAFVVPENEDEKKDDRGPGKPVSRKALQEFLRGAL